MVPLMPMAMIFSFLFFSFGGGFADFVGLVTGGVQNIYLFFLIWLLREICCCNM
jgi:hypothetical protein